MSGDQRDWYDCQRFGRDRQFGVRLAVVSDVAHVEEEREEHHREGDAEGQCRRVHRAIGVVVEEC